MCDFTCYEISRYEYPDVFNLYYVLVFFFFQAEDGIRDIGVTGVQTCALPILAQGVDAWRHAATDVDHEHDVRNALGLGAALRGLSARGQFGNAGGFRRGIAARSEEGRVGKGGRSRWSPYH